MATKHWLGGGAALGATAYALQNGVPEMVGNIASSGAGLVSGTAEMTSNAVATLLTSTGVVPGVIANAFLPTAAGVTAGYYLSNKLANWTGNSDSKLGTFMKIAGTAAGAGAGIATESVALPIILASAGLIAAKDVPLWAAGKAGQGVSSIWGGVSSFVWGGLKGAGKGALNGLKEGWNNPGLKPQVGF